MSTILWILALVFVGIVSYAVGNERGYNTGFDSGKKVTTPVASSTVTKPAARKVPVTSKKVVATSKKKTAKKATKKRR